MAKNQLSTAAPYLPRNPTLIRLKKAAADCRGCDLWQHATQTVFGEGGHGARFRVMFVGEQPGDQEDLQGRPFVGPAGRILDLALERAHIDRDSIYVTNAVKHFKFEFRGKRRIHKRPSLHQMEACRPWLEAEIAVIQPQVIVCLGATAAQSLLGKNFKVLTSRGKFVPSTLAPYVMATVHPSSVLRAPDDEARRLGIEQFVADILKIRKVLTKAAQGPSAGS